MVRVKKWEQSPNTMVAFYTSETMASFYLSDSHAYKGRGKQPQYPSHGEITNTFMHVAVSLELVWDLDSTTAEAVHHWFKIRLDVQTSE